MVSDDLAPYTAEAPPCAPPLAGPVLLCDTRNRLLEDVMVYRGTASEVTVRIAELVRPALLRNTPHLAVVHNHPSGDPEPSPNDRELTRSLGEACHLLDIEFLDPRGGRQRGPLVLVPAGGEREPEARPQQQPALVGGVLAGKLSG